VQTDKPQTAPATVSPLRELRALKRERSSDLTRVRTLLSGITSTLDLEAAGGLLSTWERSALDPDSVLGTQRIAVVGSSTVFVLPNMLRALLLARGMWPELELGGFDQWRFDVLAGPESPLAQLKPRLVVCLLDDQVIFERARGSVDVAAIEALCAALPEELLGWITRAQETLGGRVVLSTLALSPRQLDRFVDYRNKARLTAAFARMNAQILQLGADKPRTVVLDTQVLGSRAGALFSDDRIRLVASQVYAPAFLHAYAQELVRVAAADLGVAKKCLVLDLDNTLWGGIVGDDGVGGIQVGGAYPGAAHRELQELARDLMTQGVLLSVCSKNEDAVAREALRTHPDMALQPESFVTITANWDPKPDNLRAQAKQLNLGLNAFVFVDDNPAERELMRRMLPEVETVELPREPASYAAIVGARGDFNLLEITDEDRGRTSMYQAQAGREALERSAESLEDYLVSLESKLQLSPLGPLNRARVVQLFGKTNQFNMTGIRYPEEEVVRRAALGDVDFVAARLRDKFGDNGLIAALAVARPSPDEWVIENFVLSCRVFSRQVEHTLVGLVLRAAQRAHAKGVRSRFVETAKNRPFVDFYASLGFEREASSGGTHDFVHGLGALPELPRWIEITQDAGVFHAV